MAASVNHVMHRYSTTTPLPETEYSWYYLRDEENNQASNSGTVVNRYSSSSDNSPTNIPSSMLYTTDQWLYGAPEDELFLNSPAFVLRQCPHHSNDTNNNNSKSSKSKKSTTHLCKKCEVIRVPLPAFQSKFGSVRCYPTSRTNFSSTPLKATTVRVSSSSSRPSILPTADPYDLMRRSRLSTPPETTFSVSPFRDKTTNKDNQKKSSEPKQEIIHNTLGRRSILECNINPYDLITQNNAKLSKSVGAASGKRSRIRPRLNRKEYEDIDISKSSTKPTSTPNKTLSVSNDTKINEEPPLLKIEEVDLVNNEFDGVVGTDRFKSILKKQSTEFNNSAKDTENDSAHQPKAKKASSMKGSLKGSRFYISISPPLTPRKKVQFVDFGKSDIEDEEGKDENRIKPLVELNLDENANLENKEKIEAEHDGDKCENLLDEVQECPIKDKSLQPTKLYRSKSERITNENINVNFYDTTALRRNRRPNSFADKDIENLRTSSMDIISLFKNYSSVDEDSAKDTDMQVEESFQSEMESKIIDDEDIAEDKITDNQTEKEIHKKCPQLMETEDPKLEAAAEKIQIPNDNEQIKDLSSFAQRISIGDQQLNNTFSPRAPPRKRSSHKKEVANLDAVAPHPLNKTVVQVTLPSDPVHKIQIKNECPNILIVDDGKSRIESDQRKTSILIKGDECYSTVNINNNVPLYHSSVVVNPVINCSKIYISGSNDDFQTEVHNSLKNKDVTSLMNEGSMSLNQIELPKILSNNFNDSMNVSKSSENSSPILLDSLDTNQHLKHILRDPVEAVRQNLVPHVCGKSDVSRRLSNEDANKRFVNGKRNFTAQIETSHGMYINNSMSDQSENDDDNHHYESIKTENDHIYEEIPSEPPISASSSNDKQYASRSMFEGASKYDILNYLVNAKKRGVAETNSRYVNVINHEQNEDSFNRASDSSALSDSAEENSFATSKSFREEKKSAEVERNDSGVGSETSKSSLSKYRSKLEISVSCEDCDSPLETGRDSFLCCKKCSKKRVERKEIITEIVETEEKYSKDLQIILEEFYQPMLVAGLLTADQLSAIFLNVEELLENSQTLAERLRDAVEIALEQGDDDLLTVNIGKLFLEASSMLHAFESYCIRQGTSSLLLASLEKEKELLRIFLNVSQMENVTLRRMNLNSFLMVPVQRVTKYPLLLARLFKVTPPHLHDIRHRIKEAQNKIELHLNHMNSETKDVPTKLWRRIGSGNSGGGRWSGTEIDFVNIKLRKMAIDILEWNHDEVRFVLEGKLLFTQPTDNYWRKGRTIKLTPVNALLVVNGKAAINKPSSQQPDDDTLMFTESNIGIKEVALLLFRDKNSRYTLLREALYLDRCVVAVDPTWQSYFEIQDVLGRESFIFKAESEDQTLLWYKTLQCHSQGLGAWRKRRNALANIMINGMGHRS